MSWCSSTRRIVMLGLTLATLNSVCLPNVADASPQPASSLESPNEPSVTVGTIEFRFSSVESGQQILTTRDDYLSRLSPFDLQSRTQSAAAVPFDDYLQHVKKEVVPWQDSQVAKLTAVLQELGEPLSHFHFANLPTVQMIQTSGREESGAAYTRGNAIILTRIQLQMDQTSLKKLVLHELFHVISRSNPQLRDQLYAIIGFQPANEIALPDSLKDLQITNPDAPIIQHVMKVSVAENESQWVAPILYAKSSYNPRQSRSMFAYLEFALLQVSADEQGHFSPSLQDGQPRLHSKALPDFHRQIGRNTGYIIHPEEVLADNFAELVLNNTSVPDPWILEKMKQVLSANEHP